MTDYYPTDRIRVGWGDVVSRALDLRAHLRGGDEQIPVWGVPRGGGYVASLLAGLGGALGDRVLRVVLDPEDAALAVDDIVDSGRTRERIQQMYGIPLLALYDRTPHALEPFRWDGPWVIFPWEEYCERAGTGIDGIRAEVVSFARSMEARLTRNDYKGHWSQHEDIALVRWLLDEVGELLEALQGGDHEDSEKEAADVANLAMFLADNHRRRLT